jgi:hypothetical protein
MANSIKGHQKQLFVNLFSPQNIDGGITGNYICLKNVEHVRVLISNGVMGAATNLTINKAKTAAAGDATQWLDWAETMVETNVSASYAEDASPTKTFTRTTVTSDTMALSTANALYSIEFDPIELGEGYDYFTIAVSDPTGSVTDLMSAVAILDMKVCGETPPEAYS